jgi:very-short-patch-repair endonuclease
MWRASPNRARKLLSFTDNRQDASLQAGHFNDFIEVGLLRAAIYAAVAAAGPEGLAHDALGDKVVSAIDLPKELYADDPEVRFAAEVETKRAFRDVLCYRLYRDLKRGWRIIAPNLEQCGLLEIRYVSLTEACEAEDLWEKAHPCLSGASPANREKVAKVLLDYMRRELAIKVDYLDALYQNRLRQRSNQHLRAPWAIDDNERMEHSSTVYPRAGTRDDYQGFVYLSARGGFGQYLGRTSTFDDWSDYLKLDDKQQIIQDLLEALRAAGIAAAVDTQAEIKGYQIPAATIWRINLGWRRRQNPNVFGFVLDTERGYWQRNELMPEDEDPEDPMTPMKERVVPYVEDRCNCLLLEPALDSVDTDQRDQAMASLQAALKNAIQVVYQLEENELAAEPMPSVDDHRTLLLYEAAEGGAGVLRRLVEEPGALPAVAREALDLCHFDPDTGEDRHRAAGMEEDCEAACYNCLMSYGNQRDHRLLERHLIRDWLLACHDAGVKTSPTGNPRAAHLQRLVNLSGSELERHWLRFLDGRSLSLPSAAQRFVESCKTRPDFVYEDAHAVIYVDAPPHDYPERHQRDADQTNCLEDCGWEVIRFHHEDDWQAIVDKHPHVFGASH